MRLGIVLRRWRIMEERTLKEVAEEIGIPQGTLYDMEQGKASKADALSLVLRWLTSRAPAKRSRP